MFSVNTTQEKFENATITGSIREHAIRINVHPNLTLVPFSYAEKVY